MTHRKNHAASVVIGVFMVVMLALMALPLMLVVARSWR